MTSAKGPIRFTDLFCYWRDLPYQRAAMAILAEQIPPEALSRDSEWFKVWSQAGKQPDTSAPALQQNIIRLPVPWFSQLDNRSGTGYRECFSSSASMVASFYGKVSSDDQWNTLRSKHGDTTSVDAQIATFREVGLQATFKSNGTPEWLMTELLAGRPVLVGWLHKGPVSAPSGGGHWSVIVGAIGTSAFLVHDPNGEADLVNGGYLANRNGAYQEYSRRNWVPRWCVDGGGGWAIAVKAS